MAPSFESVARGYRNLWTAMHVTRPADAEAMARAIIEDKQSYKVVETGTGVPWFWVAAVHARESSRDFGGILHNGERIIGTGQTTKNVPEGRGPFSNWHDAAADAIKFMGLHLVDAWPLERILYEFERYNGFGYVSRGVNSPYVWAGTSQQQRGKFVADGRFDATHWDSQLGCAAILKTLAGLDAEVEARIGESTAPLPGSESAEDPAVLPTLAEFTTDAIVAELMRRNGVTVTLQFNNEETER